MEYSIESSMNSEGDLKTLFSRSMGLVVTHLGPFIVYTCMYNSSILDILHVPIYHTLKSQFSMRICDGFTIYLHFFEVAPSISHLYICCLSPSPLLLHFVSSFLPHPFHRYREPSRGRGQNKCCCQ